ncbi:MAG: hypothetical protein AAF447_24190 [Myxococcota bacterium]
MRALCSLAWLWLVACGGDDRRVPFQDTPAADPSEDPPTEPAPFAPAESRAIAPDTPTLDLEGAELSGAGADLRALLPVDVDDDGDQDAFALAFTARAGEAASLVLLAARREDARFVTRPLARRAFAAGCALEEATLSRPTPGTVLAQAGVRCPLPEDAEAQGEAEPGEGLTPSVQVHFVASVEAAPRLLERFALHAGPVALGLALRPGDLDDDGHEDLIATVLVTPEGRETQSLELHYVNRPGGLARDREAGTPVESLLEGPGAAAVGSALCAGELAQLELGPRRGVTCPEGWARRGALTALKERLASGAGQLAATLAEADGFGLTAEELGLGPTTGITLLDLGPAPGVSAATARHGALAFTSEGDLEVRGRPAFLVALPGGSRSAAVPGALPLRDVGLTRGVEGIVRRCAGYAARLVPTGLGRVAGAAPETVLVAEAPLVPCPAVPPQGDDGGWRVLGWAPQGLLAARLAEAPARVLVPLTADGRAAGAPEVLSAGEAPPVPLRGGRVTPDGRTFVLETRYGVLRVRAGESALWRPAGWDAFPGPRAAAVDATGERVAVLAGDRVVLLLAADAAPPEEPSSRGLLGDAVVGDAVLGDAVLGDAVLGDAVPGEAESQQAPTPHAPTPHAPTQADDVR